MTTTRILTRLKWRLVVNTVRRSGGAVWATDSVLTATAGAAAGFAWFATGRGGDPSDQFVTAVLGCSAMFFAWLLGSVFILGVDETLDPGRLALLPLTPAQLRNGLLATSVIGPAPAAVAIALLGVIAGYGTSDAGLVVVALVPPTVFVMSVAVSRALATLLTMVQRSRQGRDAAVALGAVAAVAFAVLVQFSTDAGNRESMAEGLRWSPPGWAGQAAVRAAEGDLAEAVAWLVPAMVFATVLVWAWFWSLRRLLTDTGGAVMAPPMAAAPTRGALSGGTHAGPLRAVVAKEARYLVRSPHRRSGVVVGTVVGGGFIVLQAALRGDPGPTAVFSAPVAALFMAGSANNQLGFDAGSFWLEISSGAPARLLLAGRNIVWGLSLLVPTVLAGGALAALGGGWTFFGIMVAGTAALLPVVVGVGSVASVAAPFPVPESSSPFGNREALSGRGCAVGLIGMVALMATIVLVLPGALLIAAVHDASPLVQAPAVGMIAAYSYGVWSLLVRRAARRVDGQGPELLRALDLRSVA